MTKEQKIYYSTSSRKYCDAIIPKIRIANKALAEFGFNIGDKIKVEYSKNKITITK